MTCHLCSHKLVVETDPQGTDFVMKEGLHRIRPNATEHIVTSDEPKDAFATLEAVKIDKDFLVANRPTLQKMLDSREELKDDFTLNQQMRAKFRSKKQLLKKQEE